MCSIDYKILLEYLKVFLSWPPLIFILCCIAIYSFKPEIAFFITKIKEWKFPGVTVTAFDLPQKPVGESSVFLGNSNEVKNDKVDEEIEQLDSAARDRLTYIKKNPVAMLHFVDKLDKEFRFEKIFNVIYGSQMEFLDLLVTVLPEGSATDKTAMERCFKRHLDLTAPNKPPFDKYIEFLIQSKLIHVSYDPASPGSPFYLATNLGREFLAYIKKTYPAIWDRRPY